MARVKKIKKVKKIPAVQTLSQTAQEAHKIRAAAYVRVSTDHDDQEGSYEAQKEYFEKRIQFNPEYQLVNIYADHGISATQTKNREGFNQMITDAMHGHIDIIFTKSVSRFARNTVTSLETIRKLKEKHVVVVFEKEGIRTDTAQGELVLTIMSALAQAESQSISENTQWGMIRKFERGESLVCFSRFLGYDDGWIINEKEAETVRNIFTLYLKGHSLQEIAKIMEQEGRLRVDGEKKWHVGSLHYILTNPHYTGEYYGQKTVTVDFLTKKRKTNEGERAMYLTENHHPAIISHYTFNQVQLELKHRQPRPGLDYSVSPFFYSVFCSACGGIYGRKTTHSNIQQWKKIIWKCNKLSTAWEHQSQTSSEILQTCNHRKQPANKMPTLNEHNLYLIFFRSLQKLYFASSLEFDTKIAGLDHEIMVLSAKQEDMLALLKNMIGDIQMKNRKEQRKAYEKSVEKYNQLKEDYEKQGDILYKKQELQKQLTTLQSFLASVPTEKLSYQADHDPAIDKEWLSQTYRELHIKMTVYADRVAVQFAEEIVIDVKVKNGAKSGEIDEDLCCISV